MKKYKCIICDGNFNIILNGKYYKGECNTCGFNTVRCYDTIKELEDILSNQDKYIKQYKLNFLKEKYILNK